MTITTFLVKIQFRLITHKQLMTAITESNTPCKHLVTITQTDAMEIASYHRCDGIGGAVAHTSIDHLAIMCIFHPD